MDIEKLMLKKIQIRNIEGEELYNSLIEDYSSKYVFVSTPMKEGRHIFFKNGELVEVFFVEEGKPYFFTSKVIGNFKEEDNYYIALQRPSDLVQYERRRFERVKLIQPIKIIDLMTSPSVIKGEIIDLSPVSVKAKVKLLSLPPKNYLLQFVFKGVTFNFSAYPRETEGELEGLEKLYSLYVFHFSKHDRGKSEKLEQLLREVKEDELS